MFLFEKRSAPSWECWEQKYSLLSGNHDTTLFLQKGSNEQVDSGADADLDELFFWPKESENTAWMSAAEEVSFSFWQCVLCSLKKISKD